MLNIDFKLRGLGSAVRGGNHLLQVTPEYCLPLIFTNTAKLGMDVFVLGLPLKVADEEVRPDLQTVNGAFDCYINNNGVNCVKQKGVEIQELFAFWESYSRKLIGG